MTFKCSRASPDIKEKVVSLTGASVPESPCDEHPGLLDRPTSGHYYIAEEDVANSTPQSAPRSGIGFVFRTQPALPHHRAGKRMMPAVYAHPNSSMKAMRERSVEFAEPGGPFRPHDYTPAQLSGGQHCA
ncbi:MAG: hypothetical protein ACLT8E_01145 [Akkermansia sp.]